MRQITHEFKCNLPSSFFTKTEAGEYCSACKTVVIDFTEKTNEEILSIIAVNGGNACGSAFIEQLNDERASWKLRSKFAAAGIAALLGLAPEIAKARPVDRFRTEIVTRIDVAGNIQPVAPLDTVEAPAIDTADKPEKKKKQVKRKTFLTIGRRYFFVKNVFPFIGTGKAFRGRYSF